MAGAVLALIVNLTIALLFAAAFLAIARLNSAFRSVGWFGASYAVGAFAALGEVLAPLLANPEPLIAVAFAALSLSCHLMAHGLARYYRFSLPVWALPLSFAASLALRALIWDLPRLTLPNEFLFQLPYAGIVAFCALVLTLRRGRGWIDTLLAAMFWLVGLHFLLKPLIGPVLGMVASADDYRGSAFALISHSLTGILLVSVALCLLLAVMRDMLVHAQSAAQTDALSGLFNRRGFDTRAEDVLTSGQPVALLVCDLDHFKAINDTYGHPVGDRVIAAMADVLARTAARDAVIGRIGGEEFALLLPGVDRIAARVAGEAIRAGLSMLDLPESKKGLRVTVSVGIAFAPEGEPLAALLERADRALYAAKQAGRNRIAFADKGESDEMPEHPFGIKPGIAA